MIEENKAFSSIDFIGQCLVDKERTLAFKKAISKVVKKGDIVLDLGTGSGIMALLSANSGARRVYAVELDNFVAEIARKSIILNKFEKSISILTEDARVLHFHKRIKFNVVISELLTTGMIDESQVQVINNLHNKKLVDSSTVFLPSRQDTYISLVRANFKMFGLIIPMTLHLWNWHKWSNLKIKSITKKSLLNSICFNKKNNNNFDVTIIFEIEKTGKINGLYLTSRTFLTDKIFLNDTEALNAPMLVPIPDKFVKKGQKLKLKISYIFGGSYKNFKIQFIKQ